MAFTGLAHQSRRLQIAAHDVANAQTEGFRASRAVGEELASGGVTTRVVPTDAPPPLLMRDGEIVAGSNTDMASEMVTLISTRAAYGANLAALRAAMETEEALLDVLA